MRTLIRDVGMPVDGDVFRPILDAAPSRSRAAEDAVAARHDAGVSGHDRKHTPAELDPGRPGSAPLPP